MDAVDAAAGFDLYILTTDVVNLDSRLGEYLKKEMMTKLMKSEVGPTEADSKAKKEIYEKYKDHLLPPEEVEWLGLTLSEACAKQMKMEEKIVDNRLVPLKYVFAKKVYDELKYEVVDEEENVGRFGKFRPRK